MKFLFAACLALTSLSASAECWIVGNLAGTSYFKGDDYKPVLDKYNGTLMITIKGDQANVVTSGPSSLGIDYLSAASNTVMGVSSDPSRPVIEVWSINGNKVTLTKSVSGWGKIDSVKAFVGDVVGKC